MTKPFGSLGGRDDVVLAGDLPDLGRWAVDDVAYLEADEVSPPGEFPQHGYFLNVVVLEGDREGEEVRVQVTEDLEARMVEAVEKNGAGLNELTVDVTEAVKADDEFGSWRYEASVLPESRLGPPSEG